MPILYRKCMKCCHKMFTQRVWSISLIRGFSGNQICSSPGDFHTANPQLFLRSGAVYTMRAAQESHPKKWITLKVFYRDWLLRDLPRIARRNSPHLHTSYNCQFPCVTTLWKVSFDLFKQHTFTCLICVCKLISVIQRLSFNQN